MQTMEDLLTFLETRQIAYQRWDHSAVFTVDQVNELAIPMPGIHTKNLFLRDKKGTHMFLLVAPGDKAIDLKAIAHLLGVNNLSFGSAERLQNHLGITAGSVSVLALVNDSNGLVQVIFDQEVWQAEAITAHPLVNTSTLVISKSELTRFLSLIHHEPRIIAI